MINYNNRTFRPVHNTDNGDVGEGTLFHYQQTGAIVTAVYKGGKIAEGHLLALMDEQGSLDMSYHHITVTGEMMTGVCRSSPEVLPSGKLRLYEQWRWTSGDLSEGESVVEEV
jgi:hypothetical protein